MFKIQTQLVHKLWKARVCITYHLEQTTIRKIQSAVNCTQQNLMYIEQDVIRV